MPNELLPRFCLASRWSSRPPSRCRWGPRRRAEFVAALGVAAEAPAEPLARMAGAGVVAVWQDDQGTLRVTPRLGRRGIREARVQVAAPEHQRPGRGPGKRAGAGYLLDRRPSRRGARRDGRLRRGRGERLRPGKCSEYRNAGGQPIRLYAGPPRPRIFLGLDIAWDAAPVVPANCPDCEGKPLGKVIYCLCCDRFGFDGSAPPPATEGVRADFVSGRLAGGIGEARGRKVSSRPEEPKPKAKGLRYQKPNPARRETRAERIERLKKLMEARLA